MDVYYAPKIAKYVQNPEVDVRIRPNFEARRKHTSKNNVLTYKLTNSPVTTRSSLVSLVYPSLAAWHEVTLHWARRRHPDKLTAAAATAASIVFVLGEDLVWLSRRQNTGVALAVDDGVCRHCVPDEFCFWVLQLDWFSSREEGGSLLSAGQIMASQAAAHVSCMSLDQTMPGNLFQPHAWREASLVRRD